MLIKGLVTKSKEVVAANGDKKYSFTVLFEAEGGLSFNMSAKVPAGEHDEFAGIASKGKRVSALSILCSH